MSYVVKYCPDPSQLDMTTMPATARVPMWLHWRILLQYDLILMRNIYFVFAVMFPCIHYHTYFHFRTCITITASILKLCMTKWGIKFLAYAYTDLCTNTSIVSIYVRIIQIAGWAFRNWLSPLNYWIPHKPVWSYIVTVFQAKVARFT